MTLAFSFFVYLVSLAALMFTHFKTASEIAVSMAEAALIGGLCDYIALKMIFERRWYLPNSGVLPRNREKLVDGIAATIEKRMAHAANDRAQAERHGSLTAGSVRICKS